MIAARADEHNATLQLELDKNKSEKLITALYRERSKMRAEIEELETVTENFKNDIELMDPLYKKIVDEKSAVDDELKEVLNQIKESEAPLNLLEDANKPIFENYKSLVEDQKKLEEKLGELKKSADSLSGDLGALSRERNTAQSNFDSKRTEVLLEVKHPGHLYFGDQMEVMVSSKAPSGKGLFIDKGEEAGIREGMTFMGCKSWRFKKYQCFLMLL